MKTVYAVLVCCDSLAPVEQWMPLLSQRRLEKIARLRIDRDKRMSLGAELALLAALKLNGADISGQIYCYDEHGKPVCNQPGRHISISHSGGLAVCALADLPVGADIETPRRISSSVARAMLTAEEYSKYIAGGMNEAELLEKWTIMEAYFKLTGTGIDRQIMKKITMSDSNIVIDGIPEAYRETLSSSEPECIISVCAYEPISINMRVFASDELSELLGV